MKKIIILATLAATILPGSAKTKKEEPKNDSLIFTTIVEQPVTKIKNQNSSGTCRATSRKA